MLLEQEASTAHPILRFSADWELLGPFQTGTREASWGADPLERVGGFKTLKFDPNVSFCSSLAPAGQVGWTRCHSSTIECLPSGTEILINVEFPEIDWEWQRAVYGWPAIQYQAWLRGYLQVDSHVAQTIIFYADNVIEYVIDGKALFGGDFYALRKAPVVLKLQPGSHQIDLRLVRDARVSGAAIESTLTLKSKAEVSRGGLRVNQDQILTSEIVDGKLASPFASIPVRNESQQDLQIHSVESLSGETTAESLVKSPLSLAPGQTRPLALLLSISNDSCLEIKVKINFSYINVPDRLHTIGVIALSRQALHDPHRMTFMHPGNVVSYAILRAPSVKALQGIDSTERLPILVFLHGSGLDPDSHQVRHLLDDLPDLPAWVLYPSGVTSWCGDDWHDWGFADVEAAVKAIQRWIGTTGWLSASVNLEKWLVCGHSNGGQGALFALTHHPDKAIGAAIVSGYNSIQAYVPFHMWTEADPRVMLQVQSSLNSFRHELLLQNAKGIPVLCQHGSADDNVPIYHARRRHEICRLEDTSSSTNYVELEGKDHWYDGIMNTAPLRAFFEETLARREFRPDLPKNFTFVVGNPSDMGSRGGICIDQTVKPDQLSRVEVNRDVDTNVVRLQTSNVLRFHFVKGSPLLTLETSLVVDGQPIESPGLQSVISGANSYDQWFVREEAIWTVRGDTDWILLQRHGSQLGSMNALLKTRGEFRIHFRPAAAFPTALQISRNLCQYFYADSEILGDGRQRTTGTGNVITVLLGTENLPDHCPGFPITVDKEAGIVISQEGSESRKYRISHGIGLICIRPFAVHRLELLLWGFDEDALQRAARLMPMLAGVGQPDFVVVRREMSWMGAAGALGLGSFDYAWRVSSASYLA